jgi:Protein of unknown function (DUF3108)
MSVRLNVGIIAVAGLALAGGAFYWLHCRANQARSAMAAATQRSPAPAVAEPSRSPAAEPENNAKKDSHPPAAPEAKKDPTPLASGLPVSAGEILDFTADVAKVSNVATLRLQTAEKRNFQGKNAWHLQAFAHTLNPLRMVFQLDDQFDSYSDANSMHSLQYEMHLNERGQKVDSIQRMTTTGKEPATANASQTIVLPGTRDPLGLMQYLRTVDWSKSPQVHGPVYDGHRLYDVRASLAGTSQNVTVPAGNFVTTKIDIHVFADGAEMKDAKFALYLADDPTHTPALLEAILPWTTARVGLKTRQ